MCRQGVHQGSLLALFLVVVTVIIGSHAQAQTALQSGVPVSLTLSPGTYTNHYIDVPSRATKLTVTLSADLGDLDLFLKYGSPLQGATYGALYDAADFVSTAADSHERIEVTLSSAPPLGEGRWYITPVNMSQLPLPITFTVTATVELATVETKHKLEMIVSPESGVPGSKLSWSSKIRKGTVNEKSDVYVALYLPGGPLLFLSGLGLTNQPVPYLYNLSPNDASVEIIPGIPLSGSLPRGDYLFGGVMVKAGRDILNTEDWLSNPSVAQLSFADLSHAHRFFVNGYGYPRQFIKTYDAEGGRVQVHETWVYPEKGVVERFLNGAFMEQAGLTPGGPGAKTTTFRPEHYHFDTTPREIITRHGNPREERQGPYGAGPFFDTFRSDRNLIYDGIVFGFSNDRLRFVIAY